MYIEVAVYMNMIKGPIELSVPKAVAAFTRASRSRQPVSQPAIGLAQDPKLFKHRTIIRY
jgi:hypothetical protein